MERRRARAAAGDGNSGAIGACYAHWVCTICVEFEKGRMTAKEARRALGEMLLKVGARHAEEVERTLREAEAAAAGTPKP